MNLSKGILVVAAAVSFAACAGKGMSEFTPSETEKAQVGQITNKTAELKSLSATADSNQGMNRVQQVADASRSLISYQQQRDAGTFALTSALASVTGAATEGCPTQIGSRYTWANCDDGSTTQNGFMEATETSFEIDFVSASNTGDASGDYSYKGKVTFGGSVIAGSLAFKMTSASGGFNYDFDITTTYGDLTMDANGCPISGTLAIDADYDWSLSGYASSGSSSVEFTFGPACGDLTAIGG